MKLGLLSSSIVVAFALMGCQHQDAMPPPAASMAPPPTVTSAPLPSQPPPPPPPSAPPPPHHDHGMGGRADEHVYKFDFVLTPKDPKDATLTPTMFSVSIGEHQTGEVMVGKNVPLAAAPPPGADKAAALPHMGVARQDVGLKVRAHPESIDQTSDILIDVDLELSSMESGGSIRKITSHGVVVATPGKSAQVMSLDDDKRHYDLAVTTTKVR